MARKPEAKTAKTAATLEIRPPRKLTREELIDELNRDLA